MVLGPFGVLVNGIGLDGLGSDLLGKVLGVGTFLHFQLKISLISIMYMIFCTCMWAQMTSMC